MSDIEQEIDEYVSLPDDPELAFAALQIKAYAELEHAWQTETNMQEVSSLVERQYVDTLIAFDEVNDLGILTEYRSPPNVESDFHEYFVRFRRHAEISARMIKMEAARRIKSDASTIIVLDPQARQEIYALVETIKKKLNELPLSEEKRESLFNKLNAFLSEVDRNRTRAEAFFAYLIEYARITRQIGDILKPLRKPTLQLLGKIADAKSPGESLPSWEDRRKVESLPTQPTLPSEDFDDGIPF